MSLLRAAARGVLGRGPVYALVQVTARCNQRCRICRVWTLERQGAEELPGARMGALATALRRVGVAVTTLAGEPFLRPDLAEVVAAFAAAGQSVRIQTNGTLITARALGDALDAGLGGISISLHSLRAEQMDRMTGSAGALEAALHGAAVVADLTRRRRRFLRVINMVLHPGNLDEVPALLDWCGRQGFRLSIIPIHSAPRRQAEPQFVDRLPDDLRFGAADLPRLGATADLLVRTRRQGGPVLGSSRALAMLPDFLVGRRVAWPCRAGDLYLFVDHAGRASGCHELEPEGSLFEPALVERLRRGGLGPAGRAAREACGGCLLPCWAELSLLFAEPGPFLEALEVNAPLARRWRARLRRAGGAA